MGREDNLAARYEKRYPGTGCKTAQKAERMERMDIKEGGGKHSGFAGGTNAFSMPSNYVGNANRRPTVGGWSGA